MSAYIKDKDSHFRGINSEEVRGEARDAGRAEHLRELALELGHLALTVLELLRVVEELKEDLSHPDSLVLYDLRVDKLLDLLHVLLGEIIGAVGLETKEIPALIEQLLPDQLLSLFNLTEYLSLELLLPGVESLDLFTRDLDLLVLKSLAERRVAVLTSTSTVLSAIDSTS